MESSRICIRSSVLQQQQLQQLQQQQQQQQQQHSRFCSFWSLDDDSKEQLQARFGLYLNGFMNVMGCLLVIFVPQRCDFSLDPDLDPPLHPIRLQLNATGLCEFQENIDVFYLTPFNIAVLLLNFWALFCVLFHSFLLNKREAFIIEAFDIDPLLPSDALELFAQSSTGAADSSWVLQASGQSAFFSGLCRLHGGFKDVLLDGSSAAAAADAVVRVGNLWQQPDFELRGAAKKQEPSQADRDTQDAEEIKERLQALACANHVCSTWLTVTAGSHCLNMLLSAVLIWHYYALDYRSYTVFITNIVAVSKMIMNHMGVLSDSRHVQNATAADGTVHSVSICPASLVKTQQLFFNRLDKTDSPSCC
jgi:hypothetical protein